MCQESLINARFHKNEQDLFGSTDKNRRVSKSKCSVIDVVVKVSEHTLALICEHKLFVITNLMIRFLYTCYVRCRYESLSAKIHVFGPIRFEGIHRSTSVGNCLRLAHLLVVCARDLFCFS